jgi:hypothetical protein
MTDRKYASPPADLVLRRSLELPRNRRKRQAKWDKWVKDNWPSEPSAESAPVAPQPSSPEPSSPEPERSDREVRTTPQSVSAAHRTQIDPQDDAIVGDWLTLPEVADRLGLPAGRIKQLLRDRKLLAAQRPNGAYCVPAAFLDGGQVVRGLQGTLTLLFDCGFNEAEALRWLFTADESLPGTPIQAIHEHRSTEVNRLAKG